MHSKSENAKSTEQTSQGVQPSLGCTQPWWRGMGDNIVSPVVFTDCAIKSPSVEVAERGSAKTATSHDDSGTGEVADISKEGQSTSSHSGSDGSQGQENQKRHQVTSAMPPTMAEYVIPHTQLEFGHSIAYPYTDPYYGSIMTAYGAQTLVHPQMLGMPHTRMPLPLEMAEEPVYVNAKQYHGILRRRQSRAKAESEKKLVKVRKPYLHESRHQHAMRRARGCGGRFLNTKKLDNDNSNSQSEKDTCLTSLSSLSSDQLLPHCSQPVSASASRECLSTRDKREHSDGNGRYQQHPGLSHSSFKEEGDCSGKQRNGILVGQAPQRAVAIQ